MRQERKKLEQRDEEESTATTCDEDDCNGTIVQSSTDELICNDCGLIHENRETIDRGPEWRDYDGSDRKTTRVGSPMTKLMHDKGLTTTIDSQNRDSSGNRLSTEKRKQVDRLRKWNRRFSTSSTKEQGIRTGNTEIKRIGSSLGVSQTVLETAAMTFRQTSQRDLLQGRGIETMAAACVYLAAKQCNSPRTPEEFYPLLKMNRKYSRQKRKEKFDSACRYIKKELGMEIQPTKPGEHISRFVNMLWNEDNKFNSNRYTKDRKSKIKRKAKDIIKKVDSTITNGPAPSSMSAVSIYAAAYLTNTKITQNDIENTCNVSAVTIRNYYTDLLDDYPEGE